MKEKSVNLINSIKYDIKKIDNCSPDELKGLVSNMYKVILEHELSKLNVCSLIDKLSSDINELKSDVLFLLKSQKDFMSISREQAEALHEDWLKILELCDTVRNIERRCNSNG